ncbi:MAG: hypothetical protein Q9163_000891 [Psora crenata]
MANRVGPIDRIYPMQIFKMEAARAMGLEGDMSDADLSVLLTHLARDKSAIAYDRNAVKFRSPEDSSLLLTSEDLTIASLKALVSQLQDHVTTLSARIATLSEKAKQAVANKNRVAALAALKSKRLNENILQQRAESLSQLEEIYSKIEQAVDQVALVRVMEGSTAVLRKLHKDIGDVEKVEDMIEALREETNKVEEIGSIIGAAGQDSAIVNDDDVNEELESMLQDEKGEEKRQETSDTQRRNAELEAIEKPPGTDPPLKASPTQAPTDMITKTLEQVSLDEGST